jgi:hypothetical protein
VGPRLAADSCEFVSLSYRQARSEALGNYGEVSDARIELRGRILPVRCKCIVHPNRTLSSTPEPYLFDLGGEEVGYQFLMCLTLVFFCRTNCSFLSSMPGLATSGGNQRGWHWRGRERKRPFLGE